MPAKYSIVQYYPDPTTGERINIGVLVFGNGQIHSKFLSDWRRARAFAEGDIDTAKEFANWVETELARGRALPASSPLKSMSVPEHLSVEHIERMAGEWSNAIQLTAPQPSLEDPESLLTRLAQQFLRVGQKREVIYRDRESVARDTYRSVRNAVLRKFGWETASATVKPNYQFGGKLVKNFPVDLAVRNGQVFLVSQAVSYRLPKSSEIDRQVRDALYRLQDIHDLAPDIQLDVVALPPVDNRGRAVGSFNELPEMCNEIGARLILEQDLPKWSEIVADQVGIHLTKEQLKLA